MGNSKGVERAPLVEQDADAFQREVELALQLSKLEGDEFNLRTFDPSLYGFERDAVPKQVLESNPECCKFLAHLKCKIHKKTAVVLFADGLCAKFKSSEEAERDKKKKEAKKKKKNEAKNKKKELAKGGTDHHAGLSSSTAVIAEEISGDSALGELGCADGSSAGCSSTAEIAGGASEDSALGELGCAGGALGEGSCAGSSSSVNCRTSVASAGGTAPGSFADVIGGAAGVFGRSTSPYNRGIALPLELSSTNQSAEIFSAIFAIEILVDILREEWCLMIVLEDFLKDVGGQRFNSEAESTHRLTTVVIILSSTFVIQAMTQSIRKWRANGFRNSRGEKIVNKQLIERLDYMIRDIFVRKGIIVRFWYVPRELNQDANLLAAEALGGKLAYAAQCPIVVDID